MWHWIEFQNLFYVGYCASWCASKEVHTCVHVNVGTYRGISTSPSVVWAINPKKNVSSAVCCIVITNKHYEDMTFNIGKYCCTSDIAEVADAYQRSIEVSVV